MFEKGNYNLLCGIGTTFEWPEDHYLVVSCDPGIKNFAMRIEKRFKDGKIIMISYGKVDLNDTDCKSRYEILYDYLDTFKDKFIHAHMFIVERQLPKNFDACRISQHVLSYFVMISRESKIKNPVIMDISARNKGYQLGAPKKCKDYWLKKWSVLRAAELFSIRQDAESFKLLQDLKKKDDIADTAIQIEAVFKLLKLPLTPGFNTECNLTMDEVKIKERPKPAKPEKKVKRKNVL